MMTFMLVLGWLLAIAEFIAICLFALGLNETLHKIKNNTVSLAIQAGVSREKIDEMLVSLKLDGFDEKKAKKN